MQEKRELILSLLAPPLIFLSGFLTYIFHHDYGVFTPEVILSITLISLFGILMGILLAFAGSTRLRAFGFSILIFIFFDLQFNLINTIHKYLASEESVLQGYAILIAALFFAYFISIGLHKHIATIITTIFAITILTTIALPIQKVRHGATPVAAIKKPESDMPPIIHLVLDEHIGIEGIPRDIEGGNELRSLLIEFYERWGFRLYGRAYSKYFMTYNSLTNLFNGETSPINAKLINAYFQHGTDSWMPVQNAYFRRFVDAGYRIRVYQSDHINFCQNSIDDIEYCYRYLSSSPQLIQRIDLPVSEKAELILGSYYFSGSAIYRTLLAAYSKVSSLSNGLLPAWEHRNYAFSSLGVPEVISQLKMDIVSNSRGRLFFAHLLLPHFPYIWDANCQLRTNSDTWLNRRREYQNLLTLSDELYRETAYRYYFQQTVCTVSLLNDLLESIEKDGLLDDATIIIHGDHGSRITLADPLAAMSDYFTDRDVIDGFSTLFAIRSETIEPGYDVQFRSIQNLFGELVLDEPAATEANNVFLLKGQVYQRSPMEVVPMPEF